MWASQERVGRQINRQPTAPRGFSFAFGKIAWHTPFCRPRTFRGIKPSATATDKAIRTLAYEPRKDRNDDTPITENTDKTWFFVKEKPKPNTLVFDLGFDCQWRIKRSVFLNRKGGRRPRGFEPQTKKHLDKCGELLKKVEDYGIIKTLKCWNIERRQRTSLLRRRTTLRFSKIRYCSYVSVQKRV